jgi:hypothetical protein
MPIIDAMSDAFVCLMMMYDYDTHKCTQPAFTPGTKCNSHHILARIPQVTASKPRKKLGDTDRLKRQVQSSSFDIWDQGVVDSEMTLEQLFNL